jgi:hypothetical protein
LPFTEAFTLDMEAYQNRSLFLKNNQIKYLEQAIIIDSTFAFANYLMANYQFQWSSSLLGVKEAINLGMRYRK